MPVPTLLTDEVLRKIPVWVACGLSPTRIAAKIGCTEATLKNKCSLEGISLDRRTSPFLVAADVSLELEFMTTQRALENFARKAEELKMHPNVLAALLYRQIAQDDLFNAILDLEP